MADLRSKLLGSKANFKTEEVEYEGDKYFVREMSLKERRKLVKRCSDSEGKLDGTLFQIHSIILAVKDEKGKPVFEESDAEALEEMPASSGFVGVFSDAIAKLVGGDEEDVKN